MLTDHAMNKENYRLLIDHTFRNWSSIVDIYAPHFYLESDNCAYWLNCVTQVLSSS